MEALSEYLPWRIPQVADRKESVAAKENLCSAINL
jgi:hypothetical protein